MDEKKQLTEEITRRLPGASPAQLRIIRRMLMHRHTEEEETPQNCLTPSAGQDTIDWCFLDEVTSGLSECHALLCCAQAEAAEEAPNGTLDRALLHIVLDMDNYISQLRSTLDFAGKGAGQNEP